MNESAKTQWCPRCERHKRVRWFVASDPRGWCGTCRGRLAEPKDSGPTLEISLGKSRALRLRVVAGIVVVTSGQTTERVRREYWNYGGGQPTRRRIASTSEAFVTLGTVSFPVRALGPLRKALARLSRTATRYNTAS